MLPESPMPPALLQHVGLLFKKVFFRSCAIWDIIGYITYIQL